MWISAPRTTAPTKKAAPKSQLGEFWLTVAPSSKIAPKHCELPLETGPRLRSFELIGHEPFPNDTTMFILVLQAN
jgi:hypothetical protein